MKVARVTLEIALRKEFDYLVPTELEAVVDVGSRVQVPFGARKVFGCVTGIAEESSYPALKAITKVIGEQTLVTPKVLRLARWMAGYYCCPAETALKSVLPQAIRRETPGWRERLFVRCLAPTGDLPKLSARQREVWNIIEERREMALAELVELAETTASTVKRLEDKGLVVIAPAISERDPYARETILPSQPLPLNEAQAAAFAAIQRAIDTKPAAGKSASAEIFLLFGVTGSGKTEVYLQALDYALQQGKGGIVLVPEISLTPQTVERFKARFSHGPNRTLVAVLHSQLSSGERHDEWHKIRQGRARIVIGARSAVFAPVDPLGLIIVDEEHEGSYKQEEAPRYNARDMAVVRGNFESAPVVLGSATPSLETFHNCETGKYKLLELPARADAKKMPIVRIVDMRHAMRRGNSIPILSSQLVEAITQRLEQGQQVILFLNRRGYASALQCPRCGYVANCPNCSLSLTYHRIQQKLCCHVCGHSEGAPLACPAPHCGNPAIRLAGIGTQRVEETLRRYFPHARIVRMDSDTLQRKEDYRTTLGDFRTGKIDILLGTQMIAKGLHFPNVTLVGIIYADMALHRPDFRAGERTFQLLTQVAGRAGRGDVEGEVVVQAFTPHHPAVQFARRHDFRGYYEQETGFRAQLKYPPFTRVALLTTRSRNEDKAAFYARHIRKLVEENCADLKEMIISGPAAAPLQKAEGFFRFHLMMRLRQMTALSKRLDGILAGIEFPDDVHLTVDIDPMELG